MKNLMRKIWGASPEADPSDLEGPLSRSASVTAEEGSDQAARRQLVQVLLRDVLRRHGIPLHWIECQVLMVASSTRGPGMYARLVIKHWDDRLMTYTFALQNALRAGLASFEPQSTEWLHGISWQLDVEDSCPHKKLPEKSFWQGEAASTETQSKPAASAHEKEALEDLQRLFMIRDQEIGVGTTESQDTAGYEKTQPLKF